MKCHKFEINLRKEVLREMNHLKNKIKMEEKYLKSCYSSSEYEYTASNIAQLKSQLSLLSAIVDNANASLV